MCELCEYSEMRTGLPEGFGRSEKARQEIGKCLDMKRKRFIIPAAKRWAYALGIKTSPDDLSQTVMVAVWESLMEGRFNPAKGHINTWVGAILANTCISAAKKKANTNELYSKNGSIDTQHNDYYVSEHYLDGLDIKMRLERAPGIISELYLMKIQGYTISECAEELGVSESTIKRRTRELRELFGDILPPTYCSP